MTDEKIITVKIEIADMDGNMYEVLYFDFSEKDILNGAASADVQESLAGALDWFQDYYWDGE